MHQLLLIKTIDYTKYAKLSFSMMIISI